MNEPRILVAFGMGGSIVFSLWLISLRLKDAIVLLERIAEALTP